MSYFCLHPFNGPSNQCSQWTGMAGSYMDHDLLGSWRRWKVGGNQLSGHRVRWYITLKSAVRVWKG